MLNRIVLLGRLVRDPELRKLQSGSSVANFTLACDTRTKDSDGNWVTSFIPCVAWNNNADFVSKYFRKGNVAAVDGRLVQRNFTRRDGSKGSSFEVYCDNVTFGGDSQNSNNGYSQNSNDVEPQTTFDDSQNLDSIDIPDDDLPF